MKQNTPPTKRKQNERTNKCSAGWTALTGTQPPRSVPGYRNYCKSTTQPSPESEEMNKEMVRQAQQTSLMFYNSTGQRCWEAWETFWGRTDQIIPALIAWREEEWRKEAADVLPYQVVNVMCSAKSALVLFGDQPWAKGGGGGGGGAERLVGLVLKGWKMWLILL